jgi:hypothetical protein
MPRVTIRLNDQEVTALAQLPGKDTSARVRYLLHQSSLVNAIRGEIERGNSALAAKITDALTKDSASETLGVGEFREVMTVLAQMFIYLVPEGDKRRQIFGAAAQKIRAGALPK